MNNTGKLLLFSSSCLAALLSLSDAYGGSNYSEELFDECVNVAGKSFCDSLFEKDGANSTNMKELTLSNNTDTTNSTMNWNTSNTPIRSSANSSYLTYNDNDLGFSIQYPSDWGLYNPGSEFGSVIGFLPPLKDGNVDVRIFAKGDYKSIKDFGDTFKESKDDYKLLKYYRNSSTTLSGNPAFRAIYLTTYNPSIIEETYGYKSSTSKGMMTGTLVPEKDSIYAIAYFSDSPNFDKYLPVIEKMIDSFKISGKGPVIQEDNSSSLVD